MNGKFEGFTRGKLEVGRTASEETAENADVKQLLGIETSRLSASGRLIRDALVSIGNNKSGDGGQLLSLIFNGRQVMPGSVKFIEANPDSPEVQKLLATITELNSLGSGSNGATPEQKRMVGEIIEAISSLET